MPVKLGMTHAQLIDAINSDIGLIKDQGSKIITKEFPASESETSSVQLDTKCQGKDYMFVFMDYGILEPSNYSLSADGLTVSFSPAIPANHKIIIRYFTPGSSFTNYVTDELQSNLLNYTTNRILEIPQDIKLKLNNGTLTLKAGSKVYVPNGFEADGTTPKFDEVVISSDLTNTTTANIRCALTVYSNKLASFLLSNCFSGGSAPTSPTAGTLWYDTASNKMKVYANSIWNERNDCLPIAILTANGSSYTSIDQVFNGFGYIGSTVFALPGVKCQSSIGRNADGTCTNLVRTVSSVFTYEAGPWYNATLYFLLWTNSCEGQDVRRFTRNKEFSSQATSYSFDENENKWYFSNNSQAWTDSGFNLNIVGKFVIASGKITSFKTFTVDSVANSNASNFSQAGRSYLSGLGMPSNRYIKLTVGASDSTYTAPANGWFEFGSGTTGVIQLINNTKGIGMTSITQTYGTRTFVPVEKGDVVILKYTATPSTHKFIYAEGDQ